eukprot:scaffold135_cov19-Tisochrysis_lutea.AAC.3
MKPLQADRLLALLQNSTAPDQQALFRIPYLECRNARTCPGLPESSIHCPHLLNLPDLPEGLHCLTSRTDPSFLPGLSPTELEAKRARQQELVRMAAEAMDQAALEVARKGIAAQVREPECLRALLLRYLTWMSSAALVCVAQEARGIVLMCVAWKGIADQKGVAALVCVAHCVKVRGLKGDRCSGMGPGRASLSKCLNQKGTALLCVTWKGCSGVCGTGGRGGLVGTAACINKGIAAQVGAAACVEKGIAAQVCAWRRGLCAGKELAQQLVVGTATSLNRGAAAQEWAYLKMSWLVPWAWTLYYHGCLGTVHKKNRARQRH